LGSEPKGSRRGYIWTLLNHWSVSPFSCPLPPRPCAGLLGRLIPPKRAGRGTSENRIDSHAAPRI
jgi:hypothetical protein